MTAVPIPQRPSMSWPRVARFGLPAVLAAVFGYGVWAWSYQLSNGLHVTGMRDVQVWGLYIAFFMFFVGLSAGGLIVASAGTIFGIKRLEPLMRPAIWTSFSCVVVAGLFILPDLGHPERVFNIVAYPDWHSPMVWDILVVVIYGLTSLVYFWLHTRETWAERRSWLALGYTDLSPRARARDRKIIAVFAYWALPAAVALHSITAWIIGLQRAHADWFSTIMAPLFVASALMSGLGLFILVLLALRRQGRAEASSDTVSWLGGLLAAFIAVDLFLQFAQMLTYQWSQQVDQLTASTLLLTGRYAWTLWVDVGLSLVALGLMIAPRVRRSVVGVASAAALSVVAVFIVRISLILAGFGEPIVSQQPGISYGTGRGATATGIPDVSSFVQFGHYSPTWVEYSISIGMLALFGLLLLFGARHLPLREPESAHRPHAESEAAVDLGGRTAPQAG